MTLVRETFNDHSLYFIPQGHRFHKAGKNISDINRNEMDTGEESITHLLMVPLVGPGQS